LFDIYIQEQSIDPRLRNRMMASLTVAASLTVCAGIVAWGADKLEIGSVAPPQHNEVLTVSIDPAPPPPAAPPERPERSEAVVDDGPKRERAASKVESADDFLETGKPSSDRGKIGRDEGGGDGNGTSDRLRVPTSGSPCLIGMSCTTVVGTHGPPKKQDDTRMDDVPFESMKPLYSPDPSREEIGRTRTGLGAQRPGNVRVEFCIDVNGKVARARVTKRFPGDDEIDAIARRTVAKWRFKPMLVAGRPRAACSAVNFEIRFD
jgi:TonB family protein